MTDPTTTLAELADRGPAAAVVEHDGLAVVVLDHSGEGQVRVMAEGLVLLDLAAGTLAKPTVASGAQIALAEVLGELDDLRRIALAGIEGSRQAHQAKLAAIRDYAIRLCRAGRICLSGLDQFLATFGLPEFEPMMRVHYTIRGSFLVHGTTEAHATAHALQTVPQLTGCGAVVRSRGARHAVEVEHIDHLDGWPTD